MKITLDANPRTGILSAHFEGVTPMKLVEILARELGEWPSEVQAMAQNPNTAIPYFNKLRVEWDTTTGFWTGSDGHSIIDFGETTKLSEDHTTAIVTREMWQAERDKQEAIQVGIDAANSGCLKPLSEVKARYNGPTQWRDRIREIDVQLVDLKLERTTLVIELAAEGFALIDAAVVPVEDMSDWRNWQRGDLIDVSGDDCAMNGRFKVDSFDYDPETTMPVHLHECGWPKISSMKFNSRP